MNNLSADGVTLVVHGITGGGAERVAVNLANYWVGKGRDISLITFRISDDESYSLDSRVGRIALDDIVVSDEPNPMWGREEGNVKKLKAALQTAGNKKVIAIMSRMSMRCILANDEELYDIYVCEHSYIKFGVFTALDSYFRKVLYPRAKRVVVLTERGNVEWLKKNIPDCRYEVIPNSLPESVIAEIEGCEAASVGKGRYIVHCGRLTGVKQHALLFTAFARNINNVPGFLVRLKIVGTGELEAELKRLVKELNIEPYVDFLGWRDNVFSLMKGALCLVHTSAFEGFPMVMLEAMCAGIPVVGFDCLTGPSAIIEDGVNGVLVEQDDLEAFSAALVRVCMDEEYREYLAGNTGRVKDKFSDERVMGLWEKLLFNI